MKDTRIPRKPLLWLAAALVFTVPPMFGNLAVWVPAFFLIALAAKFWMDPKGYRLRSAAAKLALIAVSLVVIFISYGAVLGIEPGVSLIVVLMSLKILEAHTAREFQVMAVAAFVLCLCGFLLSQDLITALCLFSAFSLILVALIQLHCGPSSSIRTPARIALRLLAQAVPLLALLFVFFPRLSTGFRLQIAKPRFSEAGFSDRLSPGSVTSLANSSEIAFRAEFPDGRVPPPNAMYWRGLVMPLGYGLDWRGSDAPPSLPRSSQLKPRTESVRQWITVEPHGEHWLFALDWPAEAPAGIALAPGNYLWSPQPVRKPRRYEVRSFSSLVEKQLQTRERNRLLAVPRNISPAVQALAQSWRAGTATPSSIVQSGLHFFGTQGFRYSLSPGGYKANDLDEFLFRRRVGFCEHYAAAFATLMRLAGVPARVVTGYLGGEYNEIGRFYVVRESDAHAWCEVWLPQNGWQRVDPTSVVAPDRVNLGLNSFLEKRASMAPSGNRGGALVRNLARWPLFAKTRLAWQTLNYTWETRVLSFDGDAQESLFESIGIGERGPLTSLLGILVTVAVVLLCYGAWLRWRTRQPPDRVKKLYNRFCRKAAQLGAQREPCEGPADFARRAAQLIPGESDQIRQISEVYMTIRYAPQWRGRLIDEFARTVNAFGKG